MKICPSCQEEYLDHIEKCVGCHEALISELDAKNVRPQNALLTKEDLLNSDMVPFVEGSLAHCREMEKVLLKSRISCVVYPVSLSSDGNAATLGSASEMKYIVLLRESDVEAAKEALLGKFHDEVAKEGKGSFVRDAIDLTKDSVTCPACEHTGALADGECQNCGLFLGTLDAAPQKSN